MRLAQEGIGEILLVDVVKGLAQGKAFDLEDARPILKYDYQIEGTDDISKIKGSDVVIITAGLARKLGMSREELLNKNAQILKDICLNIKRLTSEAIIIVVTNPLDLVTYFVLKNTGLKKNRVFGMGISLDSARFANLLSKKLNIPSADIDACVIGSHSEAMLPLPRFTKIKGITIDEFLNDKEIEDLENKTVNRGTEIVSLLGSGSAFFAPSAAIAEITRTIVKDQKKTIGVCAYLDGEYDLKDICIGVPCRIGKNGIEKIIELDLDEEEKKKLINSAEILRQLIKQLPL